MAQTYLKTYKFGNPQLLSKFDPYVYRLALLMAGDHLVDYWQLHVKSYFSRSTKSNFTKTGKFRLTEPSRSSPLRNALDRPYISTDNMGAVSIKNVIKQNMETGDTVQLVKVLMAGREDRNGVHYDPNTGKLLPGGTWKGFSSSYWALWDQTFTKQVVLESEKVDEYCMIVESTQSFVHSKDSEYFKGPKDVVEAYMNRRISNTKEVYLV